MAQHDVKFNVPLRPLGKTDLRFIVKRNGGAYGELHVSKGALVWIPRDAKEYSYRLGWSQLDALFKKHGSNQRL